MVVGWVAHTRQDGAEEYSGRVFRDRNRSISAVSDSLAAAVVLAETHHSAFAEARERGLANRNKLVKAALPGSERCTWGGRDTRAFNKRPDGQTESTG